MIMNLYKTLLFAGIVAAVPAQFDERTVKVDCKAVDLVVKALKIAPGASKYCSTVLKISTVTTTSTIAITSTAAATATASETVTSTGGEGGTVTITAPAVTETTTTTSTSTTTTFSTNCPVAPVKRDFDIRAAQANKCAGSPIVGFACNLISSACSCLNLPTPTSTVKTTAYATTTTTATITSTATVFVPATTITTPTTIVTETATATATACGNPPVWTSVTVAPQPARLITAALMAVFAH
ncbi:hypothetical protein C7974DRAFT_373388 [Boeremia exigua]|uniref:uncharacterized protein n=1 Tax=Boeremia exigua TaxID=749465 RepID=UPI001E8E4165|nr:uncharacterized protein C7974DRAFT_373388 [Boeremia exigua]KAH6639113.1 hypothetical protein C7974DRAFT_373388 [Boeremia exigua]